MYDVEHHSFCKILDKMTINPVWEERKNTQERIQSQSRQPPPCPKFLPEFEIFLGVGSIVRGR